MIVKHWPLVIAMLLAAAGSAVAEPLAHGCGDAKLESEIRDLMTESVDTAFKQHLVKLFDVWMRDMASQKAARQLGALRGLDAFIEARTSIEQWRLPRC